MAAERSQTRAQLSWRIPLWAAIAGGLLLPLIAMQFTDEVAWTAFDFTAAAMLLIGAGLAFELVARTPLPRMLRAIAAIAIAAAAALVWAHGAVGVF